MKHLIQISCININLLLLHKWINTYNKNDHTHQYSSTININSIPVTLVNSKSDVDLSASILASSKTVNSITKRRNQYICLVQKQMRTTHNATQFVNLAENRRWQITRSGLVLEAILRRDTFRTLPSAYSRVSSYKYTDASLLVYL